MAYLETIARHLEEIFDIGIEEQWNGQTRVEGIHFLACEQDRAGQGQAYMERAYGGQAQDLEGQLLYISDSENKLPARHPRDLLMVGLCEPLPNPHIIYIRGQIGPAQLFNAVQEAIFMRNTQKLRQEELFRSLRSSHGIKGSAHVTHTCLGSPVAVCDTSFSVIAASPVVEDTDNLEKEHGRLYLKDALFQNMEGRKVIRRIYSSSAPYVTTLDDYPYKWILESICIRHAVMGYVCAKGTVREFTEDGLELIDVFSRMLFIEMQKDASYRHPTGLKCGYFLTELLEGHFDHVGYITSHLLQLGRVQMPYYTILLLSFTDPDRKPSQYKDYFEQSLALLPNCMVMLFHGCLAMLLPGDSAEPLNETCRSCFDAFLQLNHMQASISYPYTDIAKSSIYYQQVRELSLLYAKTARPDHPFFVYYETYFMEHGSYQYHNKNLLGASVHPAITHVVEYDRTTNAEYTRTLRVYLAQNRNVLSTARELHIHKSTFFHRLGKMSDLFGIDTNGGLALFTYEYSFRVLDYLGQALI